MRVDGGYFLYEKVSMQLMQEIAQGVYKEGSCLPSERDIAERFGVDRTTVRKALDQLVDEGAVEKRAGSCSKVLRRSQSNDRPRIHIGSMIGFFVVEDRKVNRTITQPFYSDLFYEVEQQCKRHGINVMYATIKNTDEYLNLLSQISGVIIAGRASPEYFALAEQQDICALHINGYNGISPSVFYDGLSAARLMTRYLIDNGHRDLALITGSRDFFTSQNRLAGVLLTLFQHGIPIRPEWVLEGTWEYESGYRLAMGLLQAPGRRPTAIYAFNDTMALGAMQAIRELGMGIPGDISVAGGDNMRELKTSEEMLTTTNANVTRMAIAAVNHFLHTPEDTAGLQVTVPVDLIKGDTVMDIRHGQRQGANHFLENI